MRHQFPSILVAVFLVATHLAVQAQSFEGFMRGQPVIDVHLHVFAGEENNAEYNPDRLGRSPELDSLRVEWLQNELDRYQVVLALAGGNVKYSKAYARADERIWAGLSFPCSRLVRGEWPCEKEFLTYEELREIYAQPGMKSMGESLYNYYGIPPTDPRLEPYWRLAAELDLPVGVHSDSGPNRVNPKERPNYRPDFANPMLLRPILERYPGLRICLMHFGHDYIEEAIALMKDFPQVYCDISAISVYLPREVWEPGLRRLFDEGLGHRLMFGSDYSGTIGEHLRAIFDIGWLDEAQKRDILYFNAARYLRLTEAEKMEHHRMVVP